MSEFKITKMEITRVCRELKAILKERFRFEEYVELTVMYNINEESLMVVEPYNVERLKYYGNIEYKTIVMHKFEKVTIKNLVAMFK